MDGAITTPSDTKLLFTTSIDRFAPFFLKSGMTYQQYLNAFADELTAYRQAEELRARELNNEQWRNGLYIYNAIGCFIPTICSLGKKKPTKYLELPFPMSEEEYEEREEAKQREYYNSLLKQFREMSKK